MALKKSNYTLGQKPAPTSACAGALVVQRAEFPVKVALAAADILEIGILPPYHYLVGARLFVDGVPLASLGDVKLVSGNPDDPDAGRVLVGDPLIVGADLADDASLTTAGRLIKPVDYQRGIGIAIGAAITAGAKSIYLDLIYAQG